ncbi:helix-turn-helix domain-containing protein [Phenylobacterium ferrooxidans]|uniref:Helix-turn-helix domain-containing protein n=1 Tax=Phenylobacterium ferrooxidans TaxID=2982689 RepID=A0ABW6CJU0_9CAUL
MTRWTGFLAIVAEHGGDEAATQVALRAGGTELKLSARPNSRLAQMVGAEAARRIVDALGTEKVTIPMATLRGQRGRQRAAAEMMAKGASHSQIALAVDVHERTVRRVREKVRKSAAEGLPLFDRD